MVATGGMTGNQKQQPISGVTPSLVDEQLVMEIWPSISAYGLGRLVGRLFSVPGRIGPVRLTFFMGLLIFWIPLILYFWPGRLFRRYVLTNRRLLEKRGPSGRVTKEVALESIGDVRCVVRPGQKYFLAADLEVVAEDGSVLATFPGVPSAEPFRRAILRARDARVKVVEALKQLSERKEGSAMVAEAAR
jgi:hypothetical protein